MKLKKLFKFRVIILLILLLFSIVFIGPKLNTDGVLIKEVKAGGIEERVGIQEGEIIRAVNSKEVNNVLDYERIISEDIKVGPVEVEVETSKGTFMYKVTDDIGFDLDNLTIVNVRGFAGDIRGEIKEINGNEVNTSNFQEVVNDALPKVMLGISTNKEYAFLVSGRPNIEVSDIPSNNIKKGLDLEGGTRVLIKPITNKEVSNKEISDLIKILENRLNVFGLSDIRIRSASDLSGDKFVLIEIAGVTREEVRSLIEKQGKFEAKIGDEVVFTGGKEDIPFVCRDDGTCAGVTGCFDQGGVFSCRFEFSIRLSQESAKRHSEVTAPLEVNISGDGSEILSKNIDFYLDDKLVDSLSIATSLKGQEATSISISGPGSGSTQQAAYDDALNRMDELQTVLISGSLPFDIEIIKLDFISPVLGENFIKNSILTVLAVILGVCTFIFIRYRSLKISISMMFVLISEILMILGIASLIKWNIDLAAIAGIVAAVGTGVDDQIVITEEIIRNDILNWKQKLKRAFFIIFAAYFATLAAMVPLWNAGAGLLRGFAVTTIIGISVGVLITRPAFATILENLLSNE